MKYLKILVTLPIILVLIAGSAYSQGMVTAENPVPAQEEQGILISQQITAQEAVAEEEDEDIPLSGANGKGARRALSIIQRHFSQSNYSHNKAYQYALYGSLGKVQASSGATQLSSTPVSFVRKGDFARIMNETASILKSFSSSSYATGGIPIIEYGFETKPIDENDPSVRRMIEKAKDDIINRFGIDESERDKIKVIAIVPGYMGRGEINIVDLKIEDGVYRKIDRDMGLAVEFCATASGNVLASVNQNAGNDTAMKVLMRDPSHLINDILSGEIEALTQQISATSMYNGVDNMSVNQETSSNVSMDMDGNTQEISNYDFKRIGIAIEPISIFKPMPFFLYDYKIILGYTEDENDPQRTEMEFEYLVTGEELRISLFTKRGYKDNLLEKETAYIYDWQGLVVETKITRFEYDGHGMLKKAMSEIFNANDVKIADIVIKFKYFDSGALKKKTIRRTNYDWKGNVSYVTLSEYRYKEYDGKELIEYHAEYQSWDRSGSLVMTMEESFEYDGDKVTEITRKHYDWQGNIRQLTEETYEYHDNGTVSKCVTTSCYYRNGSVYYKNVNTLQYNEDKQLTLQENKAYNSDDILTYLYRLIWDYDGKHLIRHAGEQLIDGKIVMTMEDIYDYDENDNEILRVIKRLNKDGELAIVRECHKEYDPETNRLISETDIHYDYYNTGRITSKKITKWTYVGDLLTEVYAEEYVLENNNTVRWFVYITQYEYDTTGFNSKITNVTRKMNDIGHILWEETAIKEYADDGEGLKRLTREETTRDVYENNNIVERTITIHEYDEKGRNTYFEKATYYFVNGKPILRNKNVVTYVYENDILVKKVFEERICGQNGEFLKWSIETTGYSKYGRVISYILEEKDENGTTINMIGFEKKYEPNTGLLILHKEMELVGGVFTTVREESYSYDENDRKIRYTVKVLDESTGKLANQYQELYSYDDNGNMTVKTEMIPDSDGEFYAYRQYQWQYQSERLVCYAEWNIGNSNTLIVTLETQYDYDSDGRQVLYSHKEWDLNEKLIYSFSWEKEFDGKGRMTRYVEKDQEEGTVERDYAYDDEDRIVYYSQKVTDLNGRVVGWFTWKKEYDSNGKLVYHNEYALSDSGELLMVYEMSAVYDNQGRRTFYELKRWSANAAHALTYIHTERKSYEGDKLIYDYVKNLSNGTGYENETWYAYDDEGLCATKVVIYRKYKNGMLLTEEVNIYDYKKGTLITHNYDFKEFANGEIKKWNNTIREYDNKGKLLKLTYKEFDVNGNLLNWYDIQYEYGKETGLLEIETRRDYEGEKLVSKKVITYVYDSEERVIRKNVKTFGENGIFVSEEIYEYGYDGQNRKVKEELKRYGATGEMVYYSLLTWIYDQPFIPWTQIHEEKWLNEDGQIVGWTINTKEIITGSPCQRERYTTEVKNADGVTVSIDGKEYGFYGWHEDGRYRWAVTGEWRYRLSEAGELVMVYHHEADYQKFGNIFKLTSKTIQERVGNQLVVTYQETRTYLEDGQLKQIIARGRINNQLVITHRDTREYNENNRLVLRIVEELVDGSLEEIFRETYEYDSNGLCIKHEVLERGDEGLVVVYRDTYVYDEKGRLVLHIVEQRVNGKIEKDYWEKVYDESGRKIFDATGTYIDDVLVDADHKVWDFDGSGNNTLYGQYGLIDGNLVEIYRETFEWDEQDKCLKHEILQYVPECSELVVTLRDTYAYDEAGRRTLYILEKRIDGELVKILVEEHEYDGTGNKTYYKRQERINGEFVTTFEEVISYNEHGIKVYHRQVVNRESATLWEFNGAGKLTKYEEQLIGENGTIKVTLCRTYEYDAEYKMTMKKVEEIGTSGELETQNVYRYGYDGDSRLVHYEEECYTGGVLTSMNILDYTYDALGRLRGLRLEAYLYEHGSIAGNVVIAFEYNKKGQLESYSKKVYVGDALISETETKYTYNTSGNKSKQVETDIIYDPQAGEQYKNVNTYTFTIDDLVAKYKQESYILNGGGDYVLIDEYTVSFTYNMLGEKVQMQIIDKNYDDTGKYLGKVIQTNTYNSEGRVTEIVTTTWDENNDLISKEIVVYGYDEHGNRIIISEHILYDENGEELLRTVKEKTVDEDGNIISSEEDQYDADGNSLNEDSDEILVRKALEAKVRAQSNDPLFSGNMAEEEEAQGAQQQ